MRIAVIAHRASPTNRGLARAPWGRGPASLLTPNGMGVQSSAWSLVERQDVIEIVGKSVERTRGAQIGEPWVVMGEEVALAQLDGIDAELGGGHVEEVLAHAASLVLTEDFPIHAGSWIV